MNATGRNTDEDLPRSETALQAAIARSKKRLHQRALVGAVSSAVPIPLLDWAVDAALLSKLLPQISQEFGLTPAQLHRLEPHKREQIQKAAAVLGSTIIGKFVTKEMVLRLAKVVGKRMAAKQVAKFVPFAGQLAAAGIGYAALRYVGQQHIQDCVRVVREVQALDEAPSQE